jgi:hypothetical protein
MLSEAKIFFEGITHFRQLLNEAVGESAIVDAINKHKIVYIYYAGDETIMKGYRTIKPMVLGQSKSKKAADEGGYMLLRAWQEAGSTDSNKKYADAKGRYKSGWRLFRVDKITSFLPTGKLFSTDEGKMPEGYNPDDSQMTGIRAAVQVNTGTAQTNVQNTDSIDKPDITTQKLPNEPSAFNGQKEKFQYFSTAGKKQRETTADEIEHLWAIANTIKKKSREKLMVVTDEHGDMVLKDEAQRSKYPPESIVGNLKDLYLKYVKPNEKVDNSFFKNVENKTIQEMNRENVSNGTRNNRTFFKQ